MIQGGTLMGMVLDTILMVSKPSIGMNRLKLMGSLPSLLLGAFLRLQGAGNKTGMKSNW
jgi:hypothetical protein